MRAELGGESFDPRGADAWTGRPSFFDGGTNRIIGNELREPLYRSKWLAITTRNLQVFHRGVDVLDRF